MAEPFSDHVFVFHGHRGDIVKLLWWTGDGLYLLTNDRNAVTSSGRKSASPQWRDSPKPAQLSMLLVLHDATQDGVSIGAGSSRVGHIGGGLFPLRKFRVTKTCIIAKREFAHAREGVGKILTKGSV